MGARRRLHDHGLARLGRHLVQAAGAHAMFGSPGRSRAFYAGHTLILRGGLPVEQHARKLLSACCQ